MEIEKKLALMQNTYAASVAETVNTYQKLQVLDTIVEKRGELKAQSAGAMNKMMGIQTPEEVFTVLVDVFGCANWQVHKTENGFTAVSTVCKLCALSKRMGGANPCRGWCLDPMTAMIGEITGGKIGSDDIKIDSTLMDGDDCRVTVTVPVA